MKQIYLNLKRFDISPSHGGVNRLAPMRTWGETIVRAVQEELRPFADETEFVMYMPEAHLIGAVAARTPNSPIQLGSQGVFRQDTKVGGGFGAFTSNRTGNAVAEMGCNSTLIGHCEERADKLAIMAMAGATGETAAKAVDHIMNEEIKCAQQAGLHVLYCIGEKSEEQDTWQEVLGRQLRIGLDDADMSRVAIAYEPVWSIGPGKTPADRPYIEKVARFVKDITGGLPVVYGGGLKKNNAAMLASIPEIDGGLIALTRFEGEIGFYPDEYIEIIKTYLGKE